MLIDMRDAVHSESLGETEKNIPGVLKTEILFLVPHPTPLK